MIRASLSRLPTTTPATVSLWPEMYLEAEWITRSTPCASGRWWIGVAQLLSRTLTAPAARARPVRAATSWVWNTTLVGFSR